MRGFSEALALAKELNSTDPSNRELYLDGRFSLAQDESLQELASLPDLERLSLGGCKIRGSSLINFPSLQNLSWLNLTDNSIADNLGSLTVLTNLKDLDLSGNRITDLSHLEPLSALHQLSSVDISGCPAENKNSVSIRKSIFEMLAVLPALKYVNGEDLLGNEKPVDDDDGASEEEEEEDDEDFEGGEEEYEEEEGVEEEGDDDDAGAGGEAGGGGDDDDNEGDDDGAGDDDEEEGDDDEEEEEVPTAVLAQENLLSEDEEEFNAEEEDEEESDYDSDDDDAPAAARQKRKRDVDEDSEEEEEQEESEESDYDGDDV